MWHLRLFLIFLFVCTIPVNGDDGAEKLKSVWAKGKTKGCDPSFGTTRKGPWNVTPFSCAGQDETKAGFMIWEDGDEARHVWSRVRAGPLPHHFAWVDFDGDAREDLIVLSGQEDVAWTEIYVNQEKKFQLLLFSEKEYGVVVDADRDEKADIFLASRREDENNACSSLGFPPTLAGQIKDKYQSISAKYKDVNYTYDMPEEHPVLNMYMLQKIQILKYAPRQKKMIDQTSQFQDHIAWRINILEKVLKIKDKIIWDGDVAEPIREKCYKEIASTMSYWKSRVIKRKTRAKKRRKR